MNDQLAKILGEMVMEIKTLGYFPDSRISKLKTLADQVKITNTEGGPVASGVKPPKTKFKVLVELELETDFSGSGLPIEEDFEKTVTESLKDHYKINSSDFDFWWDLESYEPKKKYNPEPYDTDLCPSCYREVDVQGKCECE